MKRLVWYREFRKQVDLLRYLKSNIFVQLCRRNYRKQTDCHLFWWEPTIFFCCAFAAIAWYHVWVRFCFWLIPAGYFLAVKPGTTTLTTKPFLHLRSLRPHLCLWCDQAQWMFTYARPTSSTITLLLVCALLIEAKTIMQRCHSDTVRSFDSRPKDRRHDWRLTAPFSTITAKKYGTVIQETEVASSIGNNLL